MKKESKSKTNRKSTKRGADVKSRHLSSNAGQPSKSSQDQAENKFVLNEQALRQIIDLDPHSIFAKDIDGRYILANKAIADKYHLSVDEFIGKFDTDFPLSPETIARFRAEDLEVIRSGKPKHIPEESINNNDGTTRILSTTKIPFTYSDAEKPAVLGVSVDITEFKRAEKALRESESRLQTVLESSPIPLLLNSRSDGTILYANSALAGLLGNPLSELIGRKAADLYARLEDREFAIRELARRGSLHDFELRLRRAEGSIVWVSLSSELITLDDQPCVLSCLYDVTERKRGEQVLRQFRNMMDQSNDSIFLIDPDSGQYIDFNQTALDRLGYSREELNEKNIFDVASHIPDLNVWRQRVALVRDEGGLIFETSYKRKDETSFPAEVSARIVGYGGQEAILAIVRDITERGQADALQTAVYQIGEAANTAASMDELFRSVHSIIGQVMPARNFYIALYDEASDLLSFPYYVDEVDGSASLPATQPGRGMTEYILRTGKPLLSDAANFEELARIGEVELVGPPSPIWIGAPLIVEGNAIGVIALQDYHNASAYSERELHILEFVSGQVAKAIERTRLYQDVSRRNRILSALQGATLPLIQQTELSEVLQEILTQVTNLFDTVSGSIYLTAPDDSEITLVLACGEEQKYRGVKLQRGEGLAGKVWRDGVPMNIPDYLAWSGRSSKFEDTRARAIASVPLLLEARIMGVLEISDAKPGRTFSAEDVELLARFAELAAIAIKNARLYTARQQELAEKRIAEDALREAETKYRELVERLPVVVYTAELSKTGTWFYVSPQIESLLGFTPEEWMADPTLWRRQVHPDDLDTHASIEEQDYTSGDRTFSLTYRMRRRDGGEVWVRDEALVIPPQGGALPIMQGMLVDITERMRADALQSAIYRINDAASLSGGMDEFYRAIHEALRSVMFADNFFIALYDKKTNLLRFPYFVDENDVAPGTAPLGNGLTSYVLRNGAPLFGKSETMKKLEKEGQLETAGTRSIDWLGVPLKIENETIGVMAVQTYAQGIRYSQRDLDILKFVSIQVALSMERKQSAENLRSAEARYRTLVEQLPVVVYTNPVNNVGFTEYVSPQIKDFLGYTQEEWLKDPTFWQKVLHPEDRARVLGAADKLKEETESFDEEYRMIARDGSIVWVRDQAALLHDSEGNPLVWQGLMVDMTERKLSEGQIKLQVERLKALRTIDMFIASGTDLRLTLHTILQQVVNHLHVEAASIFLLNETMHVLEFFEGIGYRMRGIEGATLRVGESFAGFAALHREAVNVEDVRTYGEDHPLFEIEGFVGYHGMPLIAKGEVKGVLEALNRAPLIPDPEWMDFFESLAGQAALALDSASLFENLQRTNIELGLAYETTLEGWSDALDLRDKETEGHTQRVTNLTLKLAEAMGVSDKDRVQIRRGALLHDIGKMGIPDRILLKPDVLTSEEWEIMRQHPVYAYNLLSKIDYLRPALDIPYCHHERWDGSGYPRGLKAESIPLSARVFAVVDVWDALRSDRPYRPAWSKEQTLSHIKSLSGAHFDPKVVEAFLKMIGEDGVVV